MHLFVIHQFIHQFVLPYRHGEEPPQRRLLADPRVPQEDESGEAGICSGLIANPDLRLIRINTTNRKLFKSL